MLIVNLDLIKISILLWIKSWFHCHHIEKTQPTNIIVLRYWLSYWGPNKMVDVSETTFSNSFCQWKLPNIVADFIEVCSHMIPNNNNLYLMVDAKEAPSHYRDGLMQKIHSNTLAMESRRLHLCDSKMRTYANGVIYSGLVSTIQTRWVCSVHWYIM